MVCPFDLRLFQEGGYAGSPEYMSLFNVDAKWPTAAGHIEVFKVYPQWILAASDTDLKRQFADLNAAVCAGAGVWPRRDEHLRTSGRIWRGATEIAENVVSNIRAFQHIFPDVIVGHTEPMPGPGAHTGRIVLPLI
jgi:hypothetical protein